MHHHISIREYAFKQQQLQQQLQSTSPLKGSKRGPKPGSVRKGQKLMNSTYAHAGSMYPAYLPGTHKQRPKTPSPRQQFNSITSSLMTVSSSKHAATGQTFTWQPNLAPTVRSRRHTAVESAKPTSNTVATESSRAASLASQSSATMISATNSIGGDSSGQVSKPAATSSAMESWVEASLQSFWVNKFPYIAHNAQQQTQQTGGAYSYVPYANFKAPYTTNQHTLPNGPSSAPPPPLSHQYPGGPVATPSYKYSIPYNWPNNHQQGQPITYTHKALITESGIGQHQQGSIAPSLQQANMEHSPAACKRVLHFDGDQQYPIQHQIMDYASAQMMVYAATPVTCQEAATNSQGSVSITTSSPSINHDYRSQMYRTIAPAAPKSSTSFYTHHGVQQLPHQQQQGDPQVYLHHMTSYTAQQPPSATML